MNQRRRATDPGWRPALGGVFMALVPTLGARRAAKSGNTLITLRQLWVTFAAAATLLWLPVLLVASADFSGAVDGRVAAAVVVVLGITLTRVVGAKGPTIGGTTNDAVRGSAQRWFLLRVGAGEVAAMLGFFGFVASANPAVYLAGYAVAVAGLIDAAPTAKWITSTQNALEAAGSTVGFLGALTTAGIDR